MATATLNATNSQSVTITLASLSNGSTAVSNAIDNSSNKFLSANVRVKVKTGASGVSATGSCSVFLVRSTDGGTDYDDSTNAAFLGSLPTAANATTYARTFSTELVGSIGTHWKVAVVNNSGAALDSTAGNHEVEFSGLKYDIA
jgi:hypothetical protein